MAASFERSNTRPLTMSGAKHAAFPPSTSSQTEPGWQPSPVVVLHSAFSSFGGGSSSPQPSTKGTVRAKTLPKTILLILLCLPLIPPPLVRIRNRRAAVGDAHLLGAVRFHVLAGRALEHNRGRRRRAIDFPAVVAHLRHVFAVDLDVDEALVVGILGRGTELQTASLDDAARDAGEHFGESLGPAHALDAVVARGRAGIFGKPGFGHRVESRAVRLGAGDPDDERLHAGVRERGNLRDGFV